MMNIGLIVRDSKAAFGVGQNDRQLAALAALPISSWNYHDEHASARHLDPMAQDFHAAFGLNGADDKHVATIDTDGVALAAIQGLNQKVEARNAETTEFKRELQTLKQLVDQLARSKD